jgi:hypothetical protein
MIRYDGSKAQPAWGEISGLGKKVCHVSVWPVSRKRLCDRQLETGETALPVDVAKKAGFLV